MAQISKLFLRLSHARLEVVFVSVFLIAGLSFILITPPGWNADETNHAYRISQLSRGDLLSEKVIDAQSGYKAYGGLVPANLQRLFVETGAAKPGTVGDTAYKIPHNLYRQNPNLTQLRDNGKLVTASFSGSALYSPLAYVPYIPIFWLGKLLSLSFFWIIILSRLTGLVLTGIAFYWAIKCIPTGKWALFVVGLLPMVVAQAATVGADAPQIIVSVLFIAFVTRLLFGLDKPAPWRYGLLTLLGALLLLVKFVYAPLLILLVVLPVVQPNYRTRKNLLLLSGVIILSLIPGLIWTHLIGYIDINSNPQANFAAQKLFVVGHPWVYAHTLYYTFFTNTQTALDNMFGNFVWSSAPLPAIYAYLLPVALYASVLVKDDREADMASLSIVGRRTWRSLLLLTSGITVVLIATALYVYSTTLHQSSIVGIQSRYFIPILPLVLLACVGNTLKKQTVVKRSIVIISCLALVGALLTVYFRLYQAPSLIV